MQTAEFCILHRGVSADTTDTMAVGPILLLRNTPVQANTPVHAIKLPARPAGARDARADPVGTLGDLVLLPAQLEQRGQTSRRPWL